MGATSSVNNNLQNIIYISYDSSNKDNIYIKKILNDFEENKLNVLKTNHDLILDNVIDYTETINKVINDSLYVMVCITNHTIKSFIQTIEMNSILELESSSKIIYIATDKNYTPLSNEEINYIVKKNKWYPVYDDETFDETLNTIKNDIFS